MQLTLKPITPDAFAPFGEIIAAGDAIGRTDFVARLENGRSHARANLATARLAATALPVKIDKMEKHPFSSQAFLPLEVSRYVVIVAPDKAGAPDASEAIGFVVGPDVGISYRAGVWHTGMMVLDRDASMAILVHEDGTGDDCVIVAVDPFVITD